MIRDDGHRAAIDEAVAERRKRALERGELVVHGNPHGLKERREIGWTAARAEHRANRPDEIIARSKRLRCATVENLARQPNASASRVAVRSEDRGQLGFRGKIEDVGSRTTRAGAHAHVERCAATERKATRLVIELVRRDTQIEENAIERFVDDLRIVSDVSEVALKRAKATLRREALESLPCFVNRRSVLIQSRHACAMFEQRQRVPAAPERAIQDVVSISKQLENLVNEDRRVKGAPKRIR